MQNSDNKFTEASSESENHQSSELSSDAESQSSDSESDSEGSPQDSSQDDEPQRSSVSRKRKPESDDNDRPLKRRKKAENSDISSDTQSDNLFELFIRSFTTPPPTDQPWASFDPARLERELGAMSKIFRDSEALAFKTQKQPWGTIHMSPEPILNPKRRSLLSSGDTAVTLSLMLPPHWQSLKEPILII